MSEVSSIEWTRSTFNPWWGCTEIGPGCDHCYAKALAGRFGTEWGVGAERRIFADKHWNEPLHWEKKAAAEQAKDPTATWRVFCASMGDVFDNEAPEGQRELLWALIEATPHLTWLLLTKRIGNVKKMVPAHWTPETLWDGAALYESGGWPRNVWLGASICNQEEADRDIPKLLATPARVRFLSMEPLLGEVDLNRLYSERTMEGGGLEQRWDSCLTGKRFNPWADGDVPCPKVDWVIVGGESGNLARPMSPDWARSLRDQCKAAEVPFLFKQWGEWIPMLGQVEGVPVKQKTTTTDGWVMGWAGKKAAGRLLDGALHDGYPEVQA